MTADPTRGRQRAPVAVEYLTVVQRGRGLLHHRGLVTRRGAMPPTSTDWRTTRGCQRLNPGGVVDDRSSVDARTQQRTTFGPQGVAGVSKSSTTTSKASGEVDALTRSTARSSSPLAATTQCGSARSANLDFSGVDARKPATTSAASPAITNSITVVPIASRSVAWMSTALTQTRTALAPRSLRGGDSPCSRCGQRQSHCRLVKAASWPDCTGQSQPNRAVAGSACRGDDQSRSRYRRADARACPGRGDRDDPKSRVLGPWPRPRPTVGPD